jgi:hypothetical protein
LLAIPAILEAGLAAGIANGFLDTFFTTGAAAAFFTGAAAFLGAGCGMRERETEREKREWK